jgi:hypothetical protein
MINSTGGSPIFGRVLDLARRATEREANDFFDQLSPMSHLVEAYITKQRSKLHVLVRFEDSSKEGHLGYYLSEEGQLVFGKRQINRYVWRPWCPVRTSYRQFLRNHCGEPSDTPVGLSSRCYPLIAQGHLLTKQVDSFD